MWWVLGCAENIEAERPTSELPPEETIAPAPAPQPPPETGTETGLDTETGTGTSCGEPFEPLLPYDPPDALLCDIPEDYVDSGGDPANPPCPLAAGGSSDRAQDDIPPTLSIAAWNIEFGNDHAQVLAEMTGPLAGVDFFLLSEVSRHDLDSNPQGIDQIEELAAELRMYYAYAVEWDRRENPEQAGEHGVAILSKYPLGNAALLRLPALNDWWGEDQIYGGRVALAADALVGCTKLRLYAMHLDTRGLGDAGRAEQGAVVRADADASPTPLQVAGGDWNTWTCNPILFDCNDPPVAERVVEDFLEDGWEDGVPDDPGWTQLGEGFFPQKLDWIFHRGGLVPVDGQVVREAGGSDHVPVVFRFSLPSP